MILTKRKQYIWDYFVALVFIFTTGTIAWFQYVTPGVAFVFFLIIAVVNSFIYRSRIPLGVKNKSFYYCLFVFFLCGLGMIFFYSPPKENSIVGYLVAMFASYLVISRYDFYYFRRLLTNVVFWIVLLGIPVFLLTEIDLLPLTILHVSTDYEMFFIYSIGWPSHFGRFAGIWHELGACQIILNTILWLHIDEVRHWRWEKGQLIKLIVILIGLILTFSTGGYIVFLLFLCACVWKLPMKRRIRRWLYPLIIISFLCVIVAILNSETVYDKLFAEKASVSKVSRTLDILAMWQMALERPYWGYGLGTIDFWKRSEELGNVACSNGLIYGFASMGFIWAFIFLSQVYRSIKRMNFSISPLWLFLAFLLLQSNERYLEFPITFLFVFYFYSYNSVKYGK